MSDGQNNSVQPSKSKKNTSIALVILAVVMALIVWHFVIPVSEAVVVGSLGAGAVAGIAVAAMCLAMFLFAIFTGVGVLVIGLLSLVGVVLGIVLFPFLFPILIPMLVVMALIKMFVGK